nr:hypothetical protein [uncultured Sphaerochaeta sp.]
MDRQHYYSQLLSALKHDIVERRTILQGLTQGMRRSCRTAKLSPASREASMTGMNPAFSESAFPAMCT